MQELESNKCKAEIAEEAAKWKKEVADGAAKCKAELAAEEANHKAENEEAAYHRTKVDEWET